MKEAGLGYTPSEPRSLGISKEALLVRYRKYEEDRLLQDFTSVGDEAKASLRLLAPIEILCATPDIRIERYEMLSVQRKERLERG